MGEKVIFEDFQSSFIKQNRILKISIIATNSLLILILIISLGNKVHFTKSNSDIFSANLGIEELCYYSAKEISSQGTLSDKYLTNPVIKFFEENKKMRFRISKLFTPVDLKNNKCRVVFEDETGLRAFIFKIEPNSNYPFGRKISNLDEVWVSKEEVH